MIHLLWQPPLSSQDHREVTAHRIDRVRENRDTERYSQTSSSGTEDGKLLLQLMTAPTAANTATAALDHCCCCCCVCWCSSTAAANCCCCHLLLQQHWLSPGARPQQKKKAKEKCSSLFCCLKVQVQVQEQRQWQSSGLAPHFPSSNIFPLSLSPSPSTFETRLCVCVLVSQEFGKTNEQAKTRAHATKTTGHYYYYYYYYYC